MQTLGSWSLEGMERLPPTQFGVDQDELHQTTGRAGHVQDL